MTETDIFQFSKLKLFEQITKNLPECDCHNVLDVFEDLLFAWHFNTSTLRVVNWRLAQTNKKALKCQILIPSSTQNFTISKILISNGGGYAAIYGTQGLSVIELPTRWGCDGLYHDGKSHITCKVINVHEYTEDRLEVVQIRWHPNSPTDSHLLVLYSDNTMKSYDEFRLNHTWHVGPTPLRTNSEKKFSFLKSLGDTAVDFDIAPARVRNKYQLLSKNVSVSKFKSMQDEQKKVEWPIVILRGNGTIFILYAGLNTEKPDIQGPLTMLSSQENNYGDDSCSLLVIPTTPLTLVIAESSGILRHIIMLEINQNDDSKCELYVVENVELQFGLQGDRETANIFLKQDSVNEHRYYCYHDAGLHSISISFLHQLQTYVSEDNEQQDFTITSPSRAEYILSTKAFSNSRSNAVIGFGVLQSPSGLLVLLKSGQIVSLPTAKVKPTLHNYLPQIPNFEQNIIESSSKVTFDQHIKSLLKLTVITHLPILKLERDNPPTSIQGYQLLMTSIKLMREDVFLKHDRVRQEIIKRVKILELMKNQQRNEISILLECKKVVQEKAYKLADKHEDIMECQYKLQKRINQLTRLASHRTPVGSIYDKELTDQIKFLRMKTDKINQNLSQIKAKQDSQKKLLDVYFKSEVGQKFISESISKTRLSTKQQETAKEFMADMMKQIQGLKSDVQRIYNVIN